MSVPAAYETLLFIQSRVNRVNPEIIISVIKDKVMGNNSWDDCEKPSQNKNDLRKFKSKICSGEIKIVKNGSKAPILTISIKDEKKIKINIK